MDTFILLTIYIVPAKAGSYNLHLYNTPTGHSNLPLSFSYSEKIQLYYKFFSKPAPSVTTTTTPYVTVPSPVTPATLPTLEKATSTRELTSTMDGSSKKGGSKDERKQPQRHGDAAK